MDVTIKPGRVTTTSLSYDDLLGATVKKYAESVAATGLFYRNGLGPSRPTGLRLECPGIRKEFCDGTDFGRDPEGTLFFNSLTDFPAIGQNSFYNVFHNTSAIMHQKAVVVQFYTAAGHPFYAEFVARDPTGAVDYVVDGAALGKKGAWKELSLGSVTSEIQKQTKSNEFTFTMNAISKTVTFSLPPSLNLPTVGVKAYGTTYFKDVKGIKDGTKTYIDYNNDRIVFFQGANFAHAHDVVAYFIPEEHNAANATALGNYSFTSQTANDVALWKNI